MIYFSTRSFEPDQRVDAWVGMLAQYCGPFDLKARYGLDAEMERHTIAGLPCVRIAQNTLFMRRCRKELERTHQDYYYVMLQVGGRSRISQCGYEANMAPGSLVVLDSGRPLSMDYSGKNIHLCFHVPRALLEARGDRPPKLGHPLSGASASLVASLMQEAFVNAPAFNECEGEALRNSLVSLIKAAYTAASDEVAENLTAHCDPSDTLRIIHAYIAQKLGTENLSPQSVARACGVSIRQIHRLFQASDTSFGDWVRHKRLDRCAADLRNAALRDISITEIAFRWGFNDLSHFSRSFSAKFGQGPRDYRSAARGHAPRRSAIEGDRFEVSSQ